MPDDIQVQTPGKIYTFPGSAPNTTVHVYHPAPAPVAVSPQQAPLQNQGINVLAAIALGVGGAIALIVFWQQISQSRLRELQVQLEQAKLQAAQAEAQVAEIKQCVANVGGGDID